ncbi:MAG: hypothetical protein BWY32_02903 [bacterium ADurb.Bin243]|nr:MAG: hypothetical protein BWY32_02903 [bacterium ADurb.Bin243]
MNAINLIRLLAAMKAALKAGNISRVGFILKNGIKYVLDNVKNIEKAKKIVDCFLSILKNPKKENILKQIAKITVIILSIDFKKKFKS